MDERYGSGNCTYYSLFFCADNRDFYSFKYCRKYGKDENKSCDNSYEDFKHAKFKKNEKFNDETDTNNIP